MCEWCGKYVNNFVPDGDMKFCPECNKPGLIKACAKCSAPIPFPPQLYCLSCGERLTIMPMVQQAGGYVPAVVAEPEKDRREQLESKGNNWYEVLRGKAEGPDEKAKVPPPIGWTANEFARLVKEAVGQVGEQPEEEPAIVTPVTVRSCRTCGIKVTFYGLFDSYKCPICNKPGEELADQPPPG